MFNPIISTRHEKDFYSPDYFFILSMAAKSQEKIFSLGYGKTFVTKDSSTLNLTIDINRIPAQTEKAGGVYFINDVFIDNTRWGYFLKPIVDVNLGSGVSSAPNNISAGIGFGVVYDFKNIPLSWYIEGAPELVADKTLDNRLSYFSQSTYLKFGMVTRDYLEIQALAGLTNANGIRYIQSQGRSDSYGRITLPLYLKIIALKATTKAGKEYRRLHFTGGLKFSNVYADNSEVNVNNNYHFLSAKIGLYVTPNLAWNMTYFNGNEEPIFKRNNSLTLGISLAR